MKRMSLAVIFIAVFAGATADSQQLDTLKQNDSLQSLFDRSGALLKAEKYADAIPVLREMLKLDSTNALALRNLGVAFAATGDTVQARAYLARAYRFNPKDPEVCYNMGAYASNAGESADAIDYFEKACALDTNSAMYSLGLGQELLKVGRVQKALPILRKANRLSPDLPLPLFLIANCFSADNKFDSAIAYYDQCVAKGGKTPQLYYYLGVAKRHVGKMDDAEKNFKLAIARNPRYKECLQALGLLYAQEGKLVAAGAQFEKVIAVDSQFYPAWTSLGATLALTQQEQRADSIFKMLMKVDSSWGYQMVRLIDAEKSRQEQKAKGSGKTTPPKQ